MIESKSASQLLTELRDLRSSQSRRPDLVTRIGLSLEHAHKLGNLHSRDVAEAVEQVAIAALETAHLDLADRLIARLSIHYREQPHGLHRVNYLHGMALEARGLLTDAKEFYLQRLRDDETDVAVRKRLAALHLSSPLIELPASSSSNKNNNKAGEKNPYLSASLSRTEGISLLVSYLDTYYLDLSSWLSLSSAYASLGQYPAALTCLDHAVVLSPHDPFVHLKAAETAYTAGEFPLAWKGFARVVEMSLGPSSRDSVVLQGAARRAAYGAKLCIPRLRASASTSTPSSSSTRPAAAASATDEKTPSSTMAVITPDQLDKMDLLLTRLLLDDASAASRGGTTGAAAAELRSWLSGN
ncbi:hypothetical protein RHOSPDRAFT_36800 [Rhodotorula sp. JG-1b]|nr:hypothetical protein RHOSPDRAFT_36800 [Rhodotorula sp. JG-1b]